MRNRFILVGAVFVAMVAGWFLFVYRPGSSELADTREAVSQTRDEVAQLEARLRHLRDLQEREPELIAEQATFAAALPDAPSLPDFIDQLQADASRTGVDFLSITPGLPVVHGQRGSGAVAKADSLRSIAVSVNTSGSFAQISAFIDRLENLPRAVTIDDFSLGGGSEAAGLRNTPKLQFSLRLRMFMQGEATRPAQPAQDSTQAPA